MSGRKGKHQFSSSKLCPFQGISRLLFLQLPSQNLCLSFQIDLRFCWKTPDKGLAERETARNVLAEVQ